MRLQLVATSLFTSHSNKATRNCSPVAISCSSVQLPVRAKSCNWTLKHYKECLSPGRSKVVKGAKLFLTPQREAIGRHMRVVGHPPSLIVQRAQSDVSRDEGLSRRKSKGADLENWANEGSLIARSILRRSVLLRRPGSLLVMRST